MEEGKTTSNTGCKGMCTENKTSGDEDLTTSSESTWKTPSKLKEEVQTIIDIMGPSLSPKFGYNTSSEADNEESVFTNSKFSSVNYKVQCDCNDESEKTDVQERCCKGEANDANISTAADVNTTTISTTMDDLTDPRVNFPYNENFPNTQYICPPPLLPTNVCINSECFCPQVASLLHGKGIPALPPGYNPNNFPIPFAYNNMDPNPQNDRPEPHLCANKESKNAVMNWLRTMVSANNTRGDKCQYYKMNVKKKRGDNNSPPRRVVFELVQGVPQYDQINTACHESVQKIFYTSKEKKNMDNEKITDLPVKTDVQTSNPCCNLSNCDDECPKKLKKPIEKTTYCDTSGKTRVDVYYFDHGSSGHYYTTDAPPLVSTEEIADKTEKHTTRFWAEIFGTVHIGMSFVTSFILQFLRFLLYSIIRPLTIGILQLISDYFFKPMLATMFNGLIQPILIFLYNVASSLRDLCDPISEGVGYFIREFAILIGAFRIVEVTNGTTPYNADCKCGKKSSTSTSTKCHKNKVIC